MLTAADNLTPVSGSPHTADVQRVLLERLRQIPDGEVTATAKRAGLPLRHLNRLRQGKSLDVKISTLERLARGLETDIGRLLQSKSQSPIENVMGVAQLEFSFRSRLTTMTEEDLAALAERSKVPLKELQAVRSGTCPPSQRLIVRTAKALGLEADELITQLQARNAHVHGTFFGSAPHGSGLVRVGRHSAQIGAGPGFVDPLEEPREYSFAVQWLKRLGYQNPSDGDARLQVFKVAKTFGDSMEPVIRPDAILLADMGPKGKGHTKVEEAKIYVLDLSGDDSGLVVKRVVFNKKRNELVIWGDNRAYPPETVPLEDRPLHGIVRGKVRWVGQEVA